MRAIADKIDYTATAIYHHFRNKEELMLELATMDFRALAAAFGQIGRIEDPIERLRRVGEAYVDFALAHPMHYQLMFMTPHPVMAVKGITRGDPGEEATTGEPTRHGDARAGDEEAVTHGARP